VDFIGLPSPQVEAAFVGRWGGKKNYLSVWRELDRYFWSCPFIRQWPTRGLIGTTDGYTIAQHDLSFDLCLVSINPTVVIGSEREDPKVSSFWPLTRTSYSYSFVRSTFLFEPIAVLTTVPYHQGAKVFWFSPAVDYDLHQIDLTSGAASFKIGKREQIAVIVDGVELKTSRK
jgi:hypothetical protein